MYILVHGGQRCTLKKSGTPPPLPLSLAQITKIKIKTTLVNITTVVIPHYRRACVSGFP